MSRYPVVLDPREEITYDGKPTVDVLELASQLKDISDEIAPVLAATKTVDGFGLQEIELALTVGAEGGIWFIAKGSVEGSITLTFGRPKS